MDISNLFTDDDAVSPVIGVILMVAITVILAAVIGAFVLNIGGSQESAPQVTWEWDDINNSGSVDEVYVNHGGGDKVKSPSQLSFTTDLSEGTSAVGSWGDSFTAGDQIKVAEAGSSTGHVEGTIELVWESSDGSDTQILSTHDADTR